MVGFGRYRFDAEFYAPSDTLSNRYYWTNGYYFTYDATTPTYDFQVGRLFSAALASVSEAVVLYRWQTRDVADLATIVDFGMPASTGSIPGLDRVLLGNAVRVESGRRSTGLWYKRLRGLLAPADIVNELLNAEILSWLNDQYIPLLNAVALTNYLGVRVTTLAVSPRVRYWQQRRGTIRRARTVL